MIFNDDFLLAITFDDLSDNQNNRWRKWWRIIGREIENILSMKTRIPICDDDNIIVCRLLFYYFIFGRFF
jgi:hypothetical protein